MNVPLASLSIELIHISRENVSNEGKSDHAQWDSNLVRIAAAGVGFSLNKMASGKSIQGQIINSTKA